MNNDKNFLDALDIGAGEPTSVKMEVVAVVVSAKALMREFCKAFIAEARRKMPLTAQLEDALTLEELEGYVCYLLTERINVIHLRCKDYRKIKVLWIPSFVQYILSCVGEVVMRDVGLRFVPEVDEPSTMTFEEAAVISNKIAAYESKLQMVLDAMPRKVEGDPDVMSTVIIADYLRSYRRVAHPQSTYVSALLNAKLADEVAFKSLFRVQYDDIEYIRSAIVANGGRLT